MDCPSGRTLWLWSTLPKEKPDADDHQAWKKEEDAVENVNRLHLAGHRKSSFNQVRSGTRPPYTVQHDLDLLGQIVDLVKPGGRVVIVQVVHADSDSSTRNTTRVASSSTLVANLKLAGLTGVSTPKLVDRVSKSSEEEIREFFKLQGDFRVVEIICNSPDFEPGSSQPLLLRNNDEANNKKAIWNLDEVDDEEVDLVDPDTLIDKNDLNKPDAASLRVCGTTGRKKACKDCSCGLAEELADGKEPTARKSVNSSCGSCYLGDAFRCASCPYLGMPAFKPGDKIQLSDRQLKPDQ